MTIDINNSHVNFITNPFKKPNVPFLGWVRATWKESPTDSDTVVDLHPKQGDDTLLEVPEGIFKTIKHYKVILLEGGTNNSQLVEFNVTGVSSQNVSGCSSTCNSCGSCSDRCGCNGSSNHSITSETIKNFQNTVESKFSTMESMQKMITESNAKTECIVEEKVNEMSTIKFNFENELDVTKKDILAENKLFLSDTKKDIANVQYIKDELPSYRSLRSEIEEYKRDRIIIEEKNQLYYNDLETKLDDYDKSVSNLTTLINKDKLASTQLEMYNTNIESLKAKITKSQNDNQDNYNNVLNKFGEATSGVYKFQNQVGDNTEAIDSLKEWKNKKDTFFNVDYVNRQSDIDSAIARLDFSKSIKAMKEDITDNKLCCKKNSEEYQALEKRVCTLEGKAKEFDKFKEDYGDLLGKLLKAGYDTIPDDKLHLNVANIIASH